jgi:hypothetical protein
MTEYEKSMLLSNYNSAFESAKSEVRAIKSGSTGHTRPDVAYNQIEHGLSLKRAELSKHGISVPSFRCSDYK